MHPVHIQQGRRAELSETQGGCKRACRKHQQKQRKENKQLLHCLSSRFQLSVLVSVDEPRIATDVRLLPEMVESLRIVSIINDTESPETFGGIRSTISHTPAIWDTGRAESTATDCPPRFNHRRAEVAHSMPVAQTETSSPDSAGLALTRELGSAASSAVFDRIARACPCGEPSTVKVAGARRCYRARTSRWSSTPPAGTTRSSGPRSGGRAARRRAQATWCRSPRWISTKTNWCCRSTADTTADANGTRRGTWKSAWVGRRPR